MAATKAMTKAQLIAALAESSDLPKAAVKGLLEDLASIACKEAKSGFTIPGIGKLVLVNRKARTGRNPATGESIKIPAKKVVKFRIVKACKDTIVPPKN